jgi:hypothetical protein
MPGTLERDVERVRDHLVLRRGRHERVGFDGDHDEQPRTGGHAAADPQDRTVPNADEVCERAVSTRTAADPVVVDPQQHIVGPDWRNRAMLDLHASRLRVDDRWHRRGQRPSPIRHGWGG